MRLNDTILPIDCRYLMHMRECIAISYRFGDSDTLTVFHSLYEKLYIYISGGDF